MVSVFSYTVVRMRQNQSLNIDLVESIAITALWWVCGGVLRRDVCPVLILPQQMFGYGCPEYAEVSGLSFKLFYFDVDQR